MSRSLLILVLLFSCSIMARAQMGSPLGANHPELTWNQFETEHFVIIYHDGLDSIAHEAAPIAEEAYRVVTSNLQTTLPGKTKLYLSDNDEIKNAFAFSDDHIFVWLRGILDDLPHSIRSSGTSKWLRTVITHEFTHIVIDHATGTWINLIDPVPNVPRWFNEGMARYMEPDGWTDDLDVALRVATVSDRLDFDLNDYLGGVLLYEGGQSLVRCIATTYGDSALVKILKSRIGLGLYSFNTAVHDATKKSLSEIESEWHKYLTVYYATSYGQHQEVREVGRKISSGIEIVIAARLEPEAKRIAILGKADRESPASIFIMRDDSSQANLVFDQPGIEPHLSWSLDGRQLYFAKLRFGTHSNLENDIYKVDIASGELTRITSDGRYEFPETAHKLNQLVAVHYNHGGAEMEILSSKGEKLKTLTHFSDSHVQLYAPRWSPDDSAIAFSIFRANGKRDIAIIQVNSGAIRYVTDDSVNDRYAVWSPKGDTLIFVSHATGIPNLYRVGAHSAQAAPKQISDIATDIQAWDWSGLKDSLLVSSFDAKNEVSLYWYPAEHSVTRHEPAPAEPKYGAWRNIRWPLVTRTEDSIPPVTQSVAKEYNSLSHIAPLVVLPIFGTDRTPTGDNGTRFGLTMIAADPMGKHTISGFVDWGDVTHRFGGDITYMNAQLGPGFFAEVGNLISFDGVIHDLPYYELETRASFGALFAFPSSDDLTKMRLFSVAYTHREVTPWNAPEFDSSPIGLRPIAAKLQEISAAYATTSRNLLSALSATWSNKAIGSDLNYTRLRFFGDLQFSTPDRKFALAFVGRAVAQFGDILPQEFVGVSPYDFFNGGFSLTTPLVNDRLRGIRRYLYGNRLAILSAELRQPDFLFSQLIPLVGAFNPRLICFYDIGDVWYGSTPSNLPGVQVTELSKTHWLQSYGFELRTGVEGALQISTGVGWEVTKSPQPDFYFRVYWGL